MGIPVVRVHLNEIVEVNSLEGCAPAQTLLKRCIAILWECLFPLLDIESRAATHLLNNYGYW